MSGQDEKKTVMEVTKKDSEIIDITKEVKVIDKRYEDVIAELMEIWNTEELLTFNETNIQYKLERNSSEIWKFTELFHKEKNELDKILELKERLTGQLYDHYKTKVQLDLKPSEIEKFYIPKDHRMIMISRLARQQKWVVDFYDGLRKSLEKMQWNMKSFLDSMKAGL